MAEMMIMDFGRSGPVTQARERIFYEKRPAVLRA